MTLFEKIVMMTVMGVFAFSAGAQQVELLERSYSGLSKEVTPQAAKKDIQDQAAQKVSEDIIKELIGEERFLKNKSLIQARIIKNSERYIPFLKASPMTREGEEFKMAVNMKVSLRDLKQLLQTSALLNDNESVPVVLPMISWVDRVEGRSYRWWSPLEKGTQGFLSKEGRLLEESLRTSFQKQNFYVIAPAESGLGHAVPSDFQAERVSGEDSQFFAQYFNAPLLIDGQVVINRGERGSYRIELRMAALQVSNGRAIADVSRRYDTEQGAFEAVVDKKLREVVETAANDLASQVLEAWQRGSLGTSVIRVTIQGRTPFPLLESLKEKIRAQVTQVKSIRERLVSSEAMSFEVDAAISPAELLGKLEALDLGGRKLSKVSENNAELVLTWAQ
ncbi:MAG: hypothetical protein AAGB31_00340 [Bdellovibrio sp.]